jgi:murein DD-endopeptidase MepM/ murein hydrolase activator NlpD
MRLRVLASVAAVAACAPAAPRAAAEGPKLSVPIACEVGRTCEVQHYVDRDPGPGARDYRCGGRTYEKHSGVDIRVPDMAAQRRGVDVLSAAPGRVARLRDGVADISVRAPDAPSVKGTECGNGVVIDHGEGWETQYCHMAQGSVRVKPGDQVQAGTPIGKVGLSGDTEYPHVHMTVRHAGQVVDPFSPTGPAL